MDIPLKEVIEGRTRLLVPIEGDLTRKDPVFFNPVMELNRDISVAVASIAKPGAFCDLLAGTGARGIRIANEVGVPVLMNDINPDAVELIKKNAELNKLSVEVTCLDANRALVDRRFDFIDIDPFGTPVRCMDSAVRAVDTGGILGVTATDTAALCGSSPRACVKKYASNPLRTDYYNELGLRILIGFVASIAVRHEKGVTPQFSHCTHHYFKTYMKTKRGPGAATETLKNVGYLQHCFSCRYRGYEKLANLSATCVCGSKLHNSGPIWTGRFAEPDFCRKLQNEFSEGNYGMGKEALALAKTIEMEQAVSLPYYDVHKVARSMGVQPLSMEELIGAYERMGYRAVRTHFCGTGLRIDAPLAVVSEVIASDIK
jgi:tRNA (guanine26-N2/guanine27-N2)-dimethyltransferase